MKIDLLLRQWRLPFANLQMIALFFKSLFLKFVKTYQITNEYINWSTGWPGSIMVTNTIHVRFQ